MASQANLEKEKTYYCTVCVCLQIDRCVDFSSIRAKSAATAAVFVIMASIAGCSPLSPTPGSVLIISLAI